MTTRRGELHDDLRAIIAAGRELSSDHDDVLADMVLDRLASEETHRPPSPAVSMRALRRGAGAVVLALAFLTGGALISVEHSGRFSHANAVPQRFDKAAGLRFLPIGKDRLVPVVPAPKDISKGPKG